MINTAAVPRMLAAAVLPRLLAAIALLTLIAAPAVGPRAAAGEPGSTPFLQVRIDRVTPEVVTTTSDPVVTVTGTVLNVGDRPVRDVMVRLEDAAAVASSAGLRTNLGGGVDQFEPVADFITLAPELLRGQTVPFTLTYPLRSADLPSLSIEEPGVYPVLVNVNGTPDYGAPARLDDDRFLLPVLGVPPDPAADSSADTLSEVVPPDTSKPVRLTMLWPLADRPRLAAGAPGGTAPVRLIDDELAVSLAPGGRLDTLLSAVDFATGPTVDPAGQVGSALCLAVDPDLLVTVNAMTAGYVVNDGPDAGPGTPTHPGAGQDAAVGWLNRLRALAQRMCVAPTTYRAGRPRRVAARRRSGPERGRHQRRRRHRRPDPRHQIDPRRHARRRRTADRARRGVAFGAGPDRCDRRRERQRPGLGHRRAGHRRSDSAALHPAGGRRPVRSDGRRRAGRCRRGAVVTVLPGLHAGHSGQARLPGGPPTGRAGFPVVARAATRHRTAHPDPDAAADVEPAARRRAGDTHRGGHDDPRRAGGAAAADRADRRGRRGSAQNLQPLPDDELGNPRSRIDDAVTAGVASVSGRLAGLTAALTTDARTGLTGTQYTAPLREDMLRALSQSVPPDARNGLAQQRLTTVGETVDALFAAVTIVNPGGSYTLATERSPLPLALRNDLAVPIRVRLAVDAPPGMSVTDMGEIELPPGYLPLRVPIEVHFTQRVAVDVALRTADGLPLGEPVRLSVHSNAYGQVLFFITLGAGAVLALLTGRRLWHRFRGQPDRADLDRPDPLEVALSYSDDGHDERGAPAMSRSGDEHRAPRRSGERK